MELIFVRHGQPAWSVDGLSQPNPYLTSMAYGRRLQCGIDRTAMKARFSALTPEAVRDYAKSFLSAQRSVTVAIGVKVAEPETSPSGEESSKERAPEE